MKPRIAIEVNGMHSRRRVGSAPREMGFTASAQSRGGVACNNWAPWPARYARRGDEPRTGRTIIALSTGNRRTAWPPIAGRDRSVPADRCFHRAGHRPRLMSRRMPSRLANSCKRSQVAARTRPKSRP